VLPPEDDSPLQNLLGEATVPIYIACAHGWIYNKKHIVLHGMCDIKNQVRGVFTGD